MKKLITFLWILCLLIPLAGCAERRGESDPPQDQKQGQTPPQELPKEDKLAKSEEEDVEENINGYDMEDDQALDEGASKEEKDRIKGVDQQRRKELLDRIEPKKINDVLEEYDTTVPVGMVEALEYNQYDIAYDYLLITAEDGFEVRESPAPDSTVIAEVGNLDKVSLLQRASGKPLEDSEIWYRVAFEDEGQVQEGYVHSSAGVPRMFRFEKMQQAIEELQGQLAQGQLHFISNYKNQKGPPPKLEGDAALDEYGFRAYHSAPAYEQADPNSKFRYIPDGMLVRILEEREEFYYINAPTFGGNYFVPKGYINQEDTLSQLRHVVVVDRDQQNQAAFEVGENGLKLVSYTLSSTGLAGEYSYQTTLGIYKAIEKKERFEYLKKGTEEIAGYAPYALRFTGGAYIHGVPVAYEEQDGEKVDPGVTEYLHTIGTFPRSSMCVRNFTSHAKFLYDWMDTQNGGVIVIE